MRRDKLDSKIAYAQRTYNWKRKYYGKEKPDYYDLLVPHFRKAIIDVIQNHIPKHHKILMRDKYFVVTYDIKDKVFNTLSLRTAKQYINTNHRWRLQEIFNINPGRLEDILQKKFHYLVQRLKFRNTHRLAELGYDMRNYVITLEEMDNEYEKLCMTTIEDVLAELLYNVAFLPNGTITTNGKIEKSLEVKTVDLSHNSWVDAQNGLSLWWFADSVLKESYTNGLSEVWYAVHESEYGDGGNVEQRHGLQDDIRNFIQHYTSSSSYFKQKKQRIRQIEKERSERNIPLSDKYGMYIDSRNAWLLLAITDKLLQERRNGEKPWSSLSDGILSKSDYDKAFGDTSLDQIWPNMSPTANPDDEVPF